MPVAVNGQTYYRTAEVCRMVGISKSTLFRSLRHGVFSEAAHRDRRGWRLFTKEEIDALGVEVNRVIKTDHSRTTKERD
jgi:predicted site-specific integrase-resolvase